MAIRQVMFLALVAATSAFSAAAQSQPGAREMVNYNGNDAAVTPRAAVQVSIPVDGDPNTAANTTDAVKELADIADHLETKAGLLDVASTWTAAQTHSGGLISTGPGSSGAGATFAGGSPNGNALDATGSGTGAGVAGTGGSSAGNGGTFTGGGAIQGNGVVGTGTGIGYGVVGVPGNSSSSAGLYSSSANGAPALKVANTSTGFAADIGAGYLKLSGSNPSSTTGFANVITPLHFVKALGVIDTNNGSPVVDGGLNIASVSNIGSNTVRVVLASPLASGLRMAVAISDDSHFLIYRAQILTGSDIDITARDPGAAMAAVDLNNVGQIYRFQIYVWGAQ